MSQKTVLEPRKGIEVSYNFMYNPFRIEWDGYPASPLIAYRAMRPLKTRNGLMQLEKQAIYQRLIPLFREVFDDDTITPVEAMTAADVPAWDSLSNIRLVVAVEQEFHIQFTTGEVAGLSNVGEFVSVIQQRAL